MPDTTSTEDAAKDSVPGSDPKVNAAPGDTDVIAMAEAERDAGVPDMQTAEAAADAKARLNEAGESEAHPS